MNNQLRINNRGLLALTAFVIIATAAALLAPALFAADSSGAAAADLDGSRWNLVSLNGQPLLAGSAITAEFSDGKVGGSAGVNNYFASFTLESGVLAIGPAGATRMMGPEEVMSQEMAYLSALGSASSAQFDGANLLITYAEGTLTFSPAG